jgi:hypothetical protein
MLRKAVAVTTLVLLTAAGLSVLSTPAWAQKTGSSVTIQHGRVVGMKEVKEDSKAGKGALVGGTIGLIAGKNSSGKKRRRRAAGGAAVGAAAGAAASGGTVMHYTVQTVGGATIVIVSDQMEIRKDDCVIVEESGGKANIRRVSEVMCEPESQEVVEELREEFVEEARECLQAKEELVAAETDAQFDRAIRKVEILCND